MRFLAIMILMTLALLAAVPFVLAYRARSYPSGTPPIHLVHDMDHQARYNPQARSDFFADGRAMRPGVEGTVARQDAVEDDHFHLGIEGDSWAEEIPVAVTAWFVERGKERYQIYCAPWHGYSGHGDGTVAERARELGEEMWTDPTSLHTDSVRAEPAGSLYNSISRGVRTMPGYGYKIPPEDRWAIVAYIRGLQRSQNATAGDIPAEERERLRQAVAEVDS